MSLDVHHLASSESDAPIGNIVAGTFHCRKSETNSRELDVEIHYWVKENEGASPSGDIVVQIYRVR